MARRVSGNLPAEVTTFVGRREELAAAKRLLPSTRVLTLLGPGGVGKTRLSRQIGEAVSRAFPDGVWLVELADVHDPDLVTLSVAEALELRDDTTAPLPRLTSFLSDKRLLLILDNCEHLIDACAALVGRIIATTREVRVLATSREVLGIPGEQVMPVPPLPADSDGLALLTERAAAANPGFTATAANRGVLASICRRLDGIPLALELAALRLRMFTPEQVLARLDDALGLLSSGPRTAPQRQQTLEGAIGWSYDLCTPAEQRLWERLAVFAGGFDIDAVEAVCAAGEPFLDALTGLVDKSVLTLRFDGTAGRYSMLEPIRQFGEDRLAARGDRDAVRRSHFEHFRGLALRGRTAYACGDDVAWFRDLAREHANLRAALQFGIAESPQAALDMSTVLRPYWEHGRFLSEGYRRLTDALAANPEPTLTRARGLSSAASLAALLAEREPAARLLTECLALTAELATEDVAAEATLDASLLAFTDDDTAGARDLAARAADLARRDGQTAMEMDSLAFAFVCALTLDDDGAGPIAARFLEVTTASGSNLLGGLAQWSVGLDHWRRGENDAAADYLGRSIELLAQFDRCIWLSSAFDGMAWTAAARGDAERAARLMGAADTLGRSTVRLAHAITSVIGDKVRSQVRDALGTERFRTAFADGAALPLPAAIDFALGRDTPAAPEPAGPEPSVLTRRETDVARLVAAGHSNKRIAAELVISVRTAETHVEHILTKLGFTSRTQVAGWFRDRARLQHDP